MDRSRVKLLSADFKQYLTDKIKLNSILLLSINYDDTIVVIINRKNKL